MLHEKQKKTPKVPEYATRSLMPLPLSLVLFTSEKEFLAELERLGIKVGCDFVPFGASAVVHSFENDETGHEINMVCIDTRKLVGKKPEEVIAMIVHEAVHVKQHCMRFIGEKKPSKEFEAYAVQHITEALLKQFFNQNAKPRKHARKA